LSRTSNGFAHVGTLIVFVLAASGVVNYVLIAGPSLDPLVSTLYGQLLLGKLMLVLGMLALAAANRFRLSPSLEASLGSGNLRKQSLSYARACSWKQHWQFWFWRVWLG
jgi:putative copper resistance protein D